MESKTKIMKFENIALKGFQPNTLYCFDYNLKGYLCNQCLSKQECKIEQDNLKYVALQLKRLSKKECNSLKKIISKERNLKYD